MKEKAPSPVQPVATQVVSAKDGARDASGDLSNLDDALGFASGSFVQIDNLAVYVRDRLPQPDGTADFDPLGRVKEDLQHFAATGGDDRFSVGGLARSALSYLAGAERSIEELPEEHRGIAHAILRAGWNAGRHDATARLRARGARYANRGKKSDADLAAARKLYGPYHPADKDLFDQVDALISARARDGKKLSVSSAIKEIEFSRLRGRRLVDWPESAQKKLDAIRNRYGRFKRKIEKPRK